MIQVLPSINSETWNEVQERVHKIEGASDWVEIDVCDGTLSKRTTWNNPDDLKTLQAPATLRIAAHLLVKHPEKYIEQWVHAGVRRVIVQWEGIRRTGIGALFGKRSERRVIESMRQLCKDNWVEFGISLGLASKPADIQAYLGLCDIVQVLAVPIGLSGGSFSESCFLKAQQLAYLKQKHAFRVEWDGGVNLNTIPFVAKAKADIIVSTSFVFNAPNAAAALEALRRQVLL